MMPVLPPLDRAALLLDLDGTLLDIAPAPDKVVVPAGLLDVLHAIATAAGRCIGGRYRPASRDGR